MVNKQVQSLRDDELEQYFPTDRVFQEFLELFSDFTEEEIDEVITQANNFALDHNVPLKFVEVDMFNEDHPDGFLWEVIVKEALWNAIQQDAEDFPDDED